LVRERRGDGVVGLMMCDPNPRVAGKIAMPDAIAPAICTAAATAIAAAAMAAAGRRTRLRERETSDASDNAQRNAIMSRVEGRACPPGTITGRIHSPQPSRPPGDRLPALR